MKGHHEEGRRDLPSAQTKHLISSGPWWYEEEGSITVPGWSEMATVMAVVAHPSDLCVARPYALEAGTAAPIRMCGEESVSMVGLVREWTYLGRRPLCSK
jgi:hypothetical protein